LDSQFPELDSLYREIVLDHFRSPRGKKDLGQADLENQGFNPICGDEVKVSLKMEGDRIADAAINSRGCSISVAAGSMLAELIVGKTRAEVERLGEAFREMLHGNPVPDGLDLGDLDALEGVKKLPIRVKCALLAWTTLRDALKARDADKGRRPPGPSTTEESETRGSKHHAHR